MDLCVDCDDMFEHDDHNMYRCLDCNAFVCDDCIELTIRATKNNNLTCCAKCMENKLCSCKEGMRHTYGKIITVRGKSNAVK
jgi:hypothetical protein